MARTRNRGRMTTELEKEFFDTFGIEPIPIKSYGYWLIKGSIAENDKGEKVVYPEITDRVLLELICCLIKYEETFEDSQFENIKEFKNYILAKCISIKTTGDKWLAKQIQQLFKGGGRMTNIINGIDVSKYFKNHYDSWGRLYCVEYKGNPLELQNKIKRLQKENEELKAENEQLKKPCLIMPKVKQLAVPIEKYEKLYKALEEIRKEANRLLYEENPIYGYNNSNYFEILAKYVLAKTKEALNDRD